MRLYTRTGATALTDPETGTEYAADEQGGFNFPEELSERLRRFHIGKQPAWEDDIERQQRLVDEQLERAKDPATLLAVVQQLAQYAQAAQAPQDSSASVAKASRPRKTTAKTPASQ
jgi:hypothetical protein